MWTPRKVRVKAAAGATAEGVEARDEAEAEAEAEVDAKLADAEPTMLLAPRLKLRPKNIGQ